jgi:hypothetical protein
VYKISRTPFEIFREILAGVEGLEPPTPGFGETGILGFDAAVCSAIIGIFCD